MSQISVDSGQSNILEKSLKQPCLDRIQKPDINRISRHFARRISWVVIPWLNIFEKFNYKVCWDRLLNCIDENAREKSRGDVARICLLIHSPFPLPPHARRRPSTKLYKCENHNLAVVYPALFAGTKTNVRSRSIVKGLKIRESLSAPLPRAPGSKISSRRISRNIPLKNFAISDLKIG